MKLNREPNWRIKAKVIVFVAVSLSFCLVSPSGAQESESVLLRLKGQPGDVHKHMDYSITRHTTRWPDGEENVMENQMRVTVKTQVKSVSRSGRITLARNIQRMTFQKESNGEWVFPPFDSAIPGDMEKIKSKPEWGHFLLFLKSSWELEQNATGEILDYEVDIPEGSPEGSGMVFKNFVESIIEEDNVFFLPQAVRVGQSWDGGTRVSVFSGIGRIERRIKCTLSEISMQDGERIAVIKLDIAGTLSANLDAGVEAKLRKFKEEGTLLFALERGRIKRLYSKQEVVIDYFGEPEPYTTFNITERTIEEIR